MQPPSVGETKVYSDGLGHMTKMAATTICVKTPSKIYISRAKRLLIWKLCV